MKKKGVLLTILFVYCCSLISLFAQNPKEIVQKCINALGGEEAIKKHRDFRATGEIKVTFQTMSLSGKLKMINKGKKNWMRADITFGKEVFTMIRAYDGKAAWMERLGTVVDQPTLNYESQSDHEIDILLKKDAVFSIGKETEIEGKKVQGIVASFKGKKTTFFIDMEKFLILETVFKDSFNGEKLTKETIEIRMRYSDYKKFDETLYPSQISMYQKGKKNYEIRYTDIKFGPKVQPSIFTRPDQELDLRYMEELYR